MLLEKMKETKQVKRLQFTLSIIDKYETATQLFLDGSYHKAIEDLVDSISAYGNVEFIEDELQYVYTALVNIKWAQNYNKLGQYITEANCVMSEATNSINSKLRFIARICEELEGDAK